MKKKLTPPERAEVEAQLEADGLALLIGVLAGDRGLVFTPTDPAAGISGGFTVRLEKAGG